MRISVLRILTARPEKQGQLVRVNVEGGKGTVGLGIWNGGVKEFTLGAHTHPLAGSHRQRACEKARNTGRQDVRGSHTRADNAQNQRKVGDQTVVDAKDCRAEGSRQSLARTLSQRAHNFAVNSFIGCHLRGSIIVVLIGGTLFGALGHGQDENRSKHVGEHCRNASTQRRVGRGKCVFAEQREPVFFVAPFCLGEAQKHLAFLAGSLFRERAIGACLHAFFGQIAPPAADLCARGLSCCVEGLSHCSTVCFRSVRVGRQVFVVFRGLGRHPEEAFLDGIGDLIGNFLSLGAYEGGDLFTGCV